MCWRAHAHRVTPLTLIILLMSVKLHSSASTRLNCVSATVKISVMLCFLSEVMVKAFIISKSSHYTDIMITSDAAVSVCL